MADIFVVGLNHKTAPVALRERLAVTPSHLAQTLVELRAAAQLSDVLLLSTCNRVEVYGAESSRNGGVALVREFLRRRGGLDGLEPHLYVLESPQSIEHLFAVAGGLDSMVLGEGEILAQVKQAYAAARAAGTAGRTFNALFQKAFNAAKEVRATTGIGRGCVSVGSVAVDLSQKIFGSLDGRLVLVVGAGEMSRQALAMLTARGARELMIANRTVTHAETLADAYAGSAWSLDGLSEPMTRADIIITSTAAPHTIIGIDLVRRVMALRRQRPLFLIDIAVPRDVEPAVGRLGNVFLYDIDDVGSFIRSSLAKRHREVADAQRIVERKARLCIDRLNREHRGDVTTGHTREPAGAGADGARSA